MLPLTTLNRHQIRDSNGNFFFTTTSRQIHYEIQSVLGTTFWFCLHSLNSRSHLEKTRTGQLLLMLIWVFLISVVYVLTLSELWDYCASVRLYEWQSLWVSFKKEKINCIIKLNNLIKPIILDLTGTAYVLNSRKSRIGFNCKLTAETIKVH